jgi:hypothetical protein
VWGRDVRAPAQRWPRQTAGSGGSETQVCQHRVGDRVPQPRQKFGQHGVGVDVRGIDGGGRPVHPQRGGATVVTVGGGAGTGVGLHGLVQSSERVKVAGEPCRGVVVGKPGQRAGLHTLGSEKQCVAACLGNIDDGDGPDCGDRQQLFDG